MELEKIGREEILERSEDREEFLEEIRTTDEGLSKALGNMLNLRQREEIDGKERVEDLANITKQLISSDYVRFRDGSKLTFGDMLVASVVANQIKNNSLSAKELGELQKVTGVVSSGESSNTKGVQINIVANGIDLDKI